MSTCYYIFCHKFAIWSLSNEDRCHINATCQSRKITHIWNLLKNTWILWQIHFISFMSMYNLKKLQPSRIKRIAIILLKTIPLNIVAYDSLLPLCHFPLVKSYLSLVRYPRARKQVLRNAGQMISYEI